MKTNIKEKIVNLYEEGLSIHKIAKAVGLSPTATRARLIRMGLHKPKHKCSIVNGKIICRVCKNEHPVDYFPAFEAEGKRMCRDCIRLYNDKFQLAKYNCSKDKYNKLMETQDSKCAICGTRTGHISKNGYECRLAVDHDHKAGKIRGLLCNNCNRGIGWVGEDNLQNALDYIKRTSE